MARSPGHVTRSANFFGMATYDDESGTGRLKSRAIIAACGVLALAAIAVLLGNRSQEEAAAPLPTTIAVTAATAVTTAIPEPTVATTTAVPVALPCPAADGNGPQVRVFQAAPAVSCLEADKRYRAKIRTDMGTIWVLLDTANAPQTVNNFVYLARYNFYNGLPFHRVVGNFIIQTGSPTPDGEGGPGYALPSAESSTQAFKPGTVVMADRGNGSQFFIVSGTDAAALNPADFAPLGTVTQGLDVVKKIDSLATASGTSSELVTVRSLEIVADQGSAPTTN